MDTIHVAVFYSSENMFALRVDGKASEDKFATLAELRAHMNLGEASIVVIDNEGKYLYTSEMAEGIETNIVSDNPVF